MSTLFAGIQFALVNLCSIILTFFLFTRFKMYSTAFWTSASRDEAVEDTCLDLTVYGIIARIFRKGEGGRSAPPVSIGRK